jgi:hypothetical protein
MELIIILGVAVFSFYLGRTSYSEISTQLLIENERENRITERIKKHFGGGNIAKSCLGIWHIEYPYSNPLSEPLSVVRTKDLVQLLVLNNASEVRDMYSESLEEDGLSKLFEDSLQEGFENFITEISDNKDDENLIKNSDSNPSQAAPFYSKCETTYSHESITYLENYFLHDDSN